uniref:Uncharacterized protein n=1 Tax=Rhizobium leguminosarum TaxID=384 RepID=A0A179B9N0_RHILE|nr:hypothetical protein A4U53_35720 [Rhizobium leguminosarum]
MQPDRSKAGAKSGRPVDGRLAARRKSKTDSCKNSLIVQRKLGSERITRRRGAASVVALARKISVSGCGSLS